MQNKSNEVMECLLDQMADIAFITETWLTSQNNDVTANVKSYGFNLCHTIRQDVNKSRGGGVGILCRNQYKLIKLKCPRFESFECCICNLFHECHDKVVLISIYRLQDVSIQVFFNELTMLLESYCMLDTLLIIGGGINIHLDIPTNPHVTTFRNILEGFNLHQLVNEKTHVEGHQLDVLITNDCDKAIDARVINDINLSDHFPLACKIKFVPKKLPEYKLIKYRDLKSIDMPCLTDMLQCEFSQRNIANENSFYLAVSSYNDSLKSVLNAVAPIKEKTIKCVPRAPWFDYEYSELRRKRRRAEKRFRRTKLMVDQISYNDLKKETTALANRKKKFILS